MATTTLAEVKQYLYRHGTITDTTIDPVDLLRDLVEECEQLQALLAKKPTARPKPNRSFGFK